MRTVIEHNKAVKQEERMNADIFDGLEVATPTIRSCFYDFGVTEGIDFCGFENDDDDEFLREEREFIMR